MGQYGFKIQIQYHIENINWKMPFNKKMVYNNNNKKKKKEKREKLIKRCDWKLLIGLNEAFP